MNIRLAVDVGNTRTKFGFFSEREILHDFSIRNSELKKNSDYLHTHKVNSCIISSVNQEAEKDLDLENLEVPLISLNYQTSLPVEIAYESPETLGKDRIAAVVGAQFLIPDTDLLIIDAGSCITYDFLTAEKVYIGGAISPGVQMRLKSMNNYTSKLPLIEWRGVERPQQIGKTTISSMLSGVVNGLIGEINSFIAAYERQYSHMKVVITGGDSIFFEKELKNGIFADPNLVLKGLNEILIYNQK